MLSIIPKFTQHIFYALYMYNLQWKIYKFIYIDYGILVFIKICNH